MTCPDVRSRLQLLVDGEAKPDERQALEAHLDDCAECASRRAFLDALKGAARSAGESVRVPSGFVGRLAERLEEERRPRVLRLAWNRPSAFRLAAAAVLALTLGTAAFLTLSSPDPLVVALVDDHAACWKIPAAPASSRSFRRWETERGAQTPPLLSFVPEGAVRYDQRACIGSKVDGSSPHILLEVGESREHVSLYAIPQAEATFPVEAEPAAHVIDGVHVVAWKQGSWVYALVSEMAEEDLLRVASEARGDTPVSLLELARRIAET